MTTESDAATQETASTPASPNPAVAPSDGRITRAQFLTQRFAAYRSETNSAMARASDDTESSLRALVDIAVPSFCDWCAVDLTDVTGQLRPFVVRTRTGADEVVDDLSSPSIVDRERTRVPELIPMSERVLAGSRSEVWPAISNHLVQYVVAGLRVNDQPFGIVTFAVTDSHDGFDPEEIAAIEGTVQSAASAIERASLHRDARDAARRTQRIASQLHQLIATSITITSLNSEHDILLNVASRTRSVFEADTALVSLESGHAAPLRVVAQRGSAVRPLNAHDAERLGRLPSSRATTTVPWNEDGWLVAPILQSRSRARGVVAIRRESAVPFDVEDQEVLTLLAQMASNALGAAELSRSIQHSEARWRILVQSAPVGIIEINGEGGVRWWNRAAADVFAWAEYVEAAPLPAPHFPELLDEPLGALWHEVWSGQTAKGRDFLDVGIKDGRRDLTVSATILPASGNEVPSILMLVDDVTDHRQLKAELRHAHGMEVRGQVTSSVAHDFNNLLTVIAGYAEMLSQNLESDEPSSLMVKEIQATTARASILTGQLQTIGRTKSSEPAVLSPMLVIQSNAEVLERIVGGDVEISWSLDVHSPLIRIDADQFEQMILNLALNARDAMPTGGRLSISLTSLAIDGQISHRANVTPGNYAHITFTDTGIGMDESTRRRCFEPMFTTKDPLKGTGLGLSAAWRLVQESGGIIECFSELGRGTTFEILLPVTNEPFNSVATSVPPPAPRSSTVLLVDDDDGLRRLIGQVLGRHGYRVLEAQSGERALEIALEFEGSIDCLVSDVVMAAIAGDQLAQSMQHANPALRVLLISGSADSTVLADLSPGTCAFLAKPFKPSELVNELHQLLS